MPARPNEAQELQPGGYASLQASHITCCTRKVMVIYLLKLQLTNFSVLSWMFDVSVVIFIP